MEAIINTAEVLLAHTSETASLAVAELLVRRCQNLKSSERLTFLYYLQSNMGPQRSLVDPAVEAYRSDRSDAALYRLVQAVEPRRQALFRAMNMATGGTWAVMSMRADVLDLLRDHPTLSPVEADLLHVLSSWFSRGFITMDKVDWHSPGAVLERLITYEAVHEIRGWADLRRRLEADRRCFGFFHPAIPDEPLIFIEVALTAGIPNNIGDVIDAPFDSASDVVPDTATFYSITNCQVGLRGIQLGNLLIKQVVHQLESELPHVRTFATLSPVPGFARWLAKAGTGALSGDQKWVLDVLSRPGWHQDPTSVDSVGPVLTELCARYLVLAKVGGRPLDPVARFHLRNGARLERINWCGDLSPDGVRQSHGIMVNYLYDEHDLSANHETYVHSGAVVHSAGIGALLSKRGGSSH